jgi:AmmeMemoRadiSam system protein B
VDGVRSPAAAGSFYPRDARELADTVDRLLAAATASTRRRPWGLIAPHAGYAYSGPVAASAYATLRPWTERISRVALLGPAHVVPIRGAALTSARAWRTPLGDVPVDDDLRDAARAAGCLVDDRAHAFEHALEVQLPFLQRLLGARLRVVPIAVGWGDAVPALEAVASLADLVVVSTDLSHYHDAETARRIDRRTAEAVTSRDPDGVGPEDACGRAALRAALALARRDGRPIELLDLRTSAETAGDPDRVVGYGAFAIGHAGRG